MKLPNWMLFFSLLIVGLSQYSAPAFAFVPAFTGDSSALKSAPNAIAMVNINKANATELASIPGLGAKKAQAIIDYRKLNGKFKSVDELVNVKGIGNKLMAKVKPYVSI